MCVRICTWEYVTKFDGQPSEYQIVKQLAEDFPQLDLKRVFLNLMISFNSVEGRKYRFLVMVQDETIARKHVLSKRLLPPQIWMFGWADEYLRQSSVDFGNGLFWKVENGTLFIQVFLEGRLCHWSEECGYEGPDEEVTGSVEEVADLVERRLERFRTFLKEDDLFSRGECFPEIEIIGPCRKPLFKRAAKDSFWKFVDLRECEKCPVVVWNVARKFRGLVLLAVALLLAAVLWTQNLFSVEDLFTPTDMQDVPLVELSAPPLFEIVEEKKSVRVLARRKTACNLPQIRLRGIVAPQLFVAEIKGNQTAKNQIMEKQTAPETRTFKVGDSLGEFVVSEIRRSQVELTCRDSVVSISAK